MSKLDPQSRPRLPAWVKQYVPILISAAILFYYFHDQDWREFYDNARGARLWLAAAAAAIPQVTMWITTVLVTAWTMAWFHGPFPFWKYFWMRGAIFILQIVNNPLAAGGSLLYIQRKTGIAWWKLLGIGGFRAQLGIWAFALAMIPVTLSMHYYGLNENLKINIHLWWGWLIAQIPFLAFTWIFWHNKLDPTRLGAVIVRDRESDFWHAFNNATPKQWLIVSGMVLPQIALVLTSYYILALAFDVRIPFWEFLVVIPIVLFVSNLPIAFGGFGTTTYAWLTFFGEYDNGGAIEAMTLFIPTARLIIRALFGLVSLPPVIKEIGLISRTEEEAPEGTEDEQTEGDPDRS